MQADQSPPRTTLTGQQMSTKKLSRDDDEIEQDRLRVASDKKRKRKKEKPFACSVINYDGAAVESTIPMQTEIAGLMQTEVPEATTYQSSSNADTNFESTLISPREKRQYTLASQYQNHQ